MERNDQILILRLMGFDLKKVAKQFGLTRLEVRKIESDLLNRKGNK